MTYVSPQKALAHMDRLAAWQAGRKAAPVTVEVDLSNRCVLGCMDCHFAHTHVRGPWAQAVRRALPMAYDGTGDLMDLQLARRMLAEMAESGVRGVIWSGGGEPTANPSWPEIVAYGAARGLEQGIYTCGGLLDRAGADVLARHAAWAVVSLDAADGDTYAAEKGVPAARFTAACDGARHLAEASAAGGGRLVVGVSFLLHRDNWNRADRMRRFALEQLGATYATFRPAIRTSPDRPAECADDRRWVTDAWPTLRWLESLPRVECSADRFARYRDWAGRGYDACHGIKLTATVTPDGRVWVCPQRRGVAGSCVGDLRTESFRELWDRHPGQWTDFSACRVMCRLHLINEQLAPAFAARRHEAFV